MCCRCVVASALSLTLARGLLVEPQLWLDLEPQIDSRERFVLLRLADAIAKLETSANALASVGHPRPRLVYGIETCDVSVFEDMLLAQLSSWGARVPREDIIIVGGKHDTGPEPLLCQEVNSGPSRLCKEATLMFRAARRAAQGEMDWLVGLHEDSFLRLKSLDLLALQSPEQAWAFSGFGCGQNWTYHTESDEGRAPIPEGWREPDPSCPMVEMHGGMCSSAAFFVSKGALETLTRDLTLAKFIAEHASVSVSGQTDIATSCLFYKAGVQMFVMPAGLEGAQVDGYNNDNYTYEAIKEDWERRGHIDPAWIHVNPPKPVVPNVMRALDRIMNEEQPV